MAATGILIPIVYALLVGVLLGRPGASPRSFRDAAVLGAVVLAAWADAGAELLSIPHALTYGPVLAWWLTPMVVLIPLLVRGRQNIGEWARALPRPGRRTLLLVGLGILPLLAVTGVVAAITPPTTWDCVAYHMPRQMHWMLRGGVQNFPAHDSRQLDMSPLSEFIGVHWMILSDGDWAANLVQWGSLALSVCAASAIARDLGGSGPVQALAGLLAVALPAAATQALNPKNDVVCGFFALALLQQGVQVWTLRRFTWGRAGLIGLILGLLWLTKGTGLVVAAPTCGLIAWAALRAVGWRAVLPGACLGILAMAINAPHAARNIATFHKLIGHTASQTNFPPKNLIHTPRAVASNIVRNLATMLSTPWYPVNNRMREGVERIHGVLGIAANDPRTTLMTRDKFFVGLNWHEDGNNPSHTHVILGAVLLGAMAVRRRAWLAAPAWPFYLVGPATFVLYCALLTWQPWQNRLLIPVEMLSIPFGAVFLNLGWAKWPRCVAAVVAPLLAWPCLLYNDAKPLVGSTAVWGKPREQARFTVQPALRTPIEEAIAYVRAQHARSVGLSLGWVNSYFLLYPLTWPKATAVHVVMVDPNFGPQESPDEHPDLIIRWTMGLRDPERKVYNSREYVTVAQWDTVRMMAPAEGP